MYVHSISFQEAHQMEKRPVLVVMAAGMGSRYGGLKQIDPVGLHGEAILDYSLYDAYEAGFRTAVIIIKEAIRETFMETVGKRLEKCPLEIRYAYQEVDMLPAGYHVPVRRTKPWGTSHCVLCAKQAIDGAPFAAINADDYYGKSAYRALFSHLSTAHDGDFAEYCMVGYRLDKTVTEHGSVARGVCVMGADGYLAKIDERTRVERRADAICFTEDGLHWTELPPDTVVSMNMWGFTPSFLPAIEPRFARFLDTVPDPAKSEWYLPVVVAQLLAEGKTRVRVLHSPDQWYGVTYAADKPKVVAAIRGMTAEGLYPEDLWG